jgi:flagellar basal-body rod modification protein FlgD
MASAISALTGAAQSNGQAASAAATTTAPSKEMFLQLLVAQIKNQDPLNPTDSVQFVSQLAQFSELEQMIAIRQDIEGTASAATQQV